MRSEPLLVFGHRGAAGHAPENTLLSVSRALDFGTDGVEVDVRTCLGGELVIFHDETLERVTGAKGRVADTPLSQIRSLDAGFGERIPLAEEVLDLVQGRAILNLEIKDPRSVGPLARLLEGRLRGGHPPEELLVSCFQVQVLREFRSLLPRVPLALLSAPSRAQCLKEARVLGAEAIHLGREAAGVDAIEDGHRAGLRVRFYTVNEPGDVLALSQMGADGVFTDFPDRALDVRTPRGGSG